MKNLDHLPHRTSRSNKKFRALNLKMLNSADSSSFSDLVSVFLKVFGQLALIFFNILDAYSKF